MTGISFVEAADNLKDAMAAVTESMDSVEDFTFEVAARHVAPVLMLVCQAQPHSGGI